MNTVTVMNETDHPAQVILERGASDNAVGLRASLPVAPGAQTVMRTPYDLTVTAAVTMEDGITYTTGVTTLHSMNAFDLLAQMRVAGDVFSFEIVVEPGLTPDLITLHNSCRPPVTFTLRLTDSPQEARPALERRLMVARGDQVRVGIGEGYRVYAVVDGITTEIIRIDEHASVIVCRDPVDIGSWPAYTLRQGPGGALPTIAPDQATEADEGD